MAASGYIAQHFGYTGAFVSFAGVAALGIVFLWMLFGETRPVPAGGTAAARA
jgi:hypothetical protein